MEKVGGTWCHVSPASKFASGPPEQNDFLLVINYEMNQTKGFKDEKIGSPFFSHTHTRAHQ